MINRNYVPLRTRGIYSEPNPRFGNDIPGALWANSRVTFPGIAAIDTNGKDAWIGFPARVGTRQATSNPSVLMPGSNLDAANRNWSMAQNRALAQRAGLVANIATGDPQGVGYMASGN